MSRAQWRASARQDLSHGESVWLLFPWGVGVASFPTIALQQNQRREKKFTTRKACEKMSACGHQPSCSNRLGESSRLAVFLLFYKEKGFYARTLVTPAGVI